MTDRARWDRLAEAITTTVISVALTSRTYSGGVTYFIGRSLPNGDRVEVHDKWWRKNHDVWIGYQVHVESREGLVRRTWPITKKRSEVVAAVREALTLAAAA